MDYSWKGSYPVTNPFGVYDPVAYANYPGARHPGEDYAVPANTQYYASMSGHVTVYDRPANIRTGRGKEVVITNGDIERIECHMNRIDVKNGQWVNKGDPIGLSGNTGYVLPTPTPQKPNNGAHAHSEAKIKGVRVALSKHITKPSTPSTGGTKVTAAEATSMLNGLAKQVFGKPFDKGGLAHYVGLITSGTYSPEKAITEIINGEQAQNYLKSKYQKTVVKEVPSTGTAATPDQVIGGRIIADIRKAVIK